jgi:hypothetical protein
MLDTGFRLRRTRLDICYNPMDIVDIKRFEAREAARGKDKRATDGERVA